MTNAILTGLMILGVLIVIAGVLIFGITLIIAGSIIAVLTFTHLALRHIDARPTHERN